MEIFSIVRGLIGLVFVTGIAFLFSPDKRSVNWRLVIIGIVMQFVFALFILKVAVGHIIFATISKCFVQSL